MPDGKNGPPRARQKLPGESFAPPGERSTDRRKRVHRIDLRARSRLAPPLPFPAADPDPRLAMSHQLVVDLARNAVMLALLVAGPMLVVALGVGLVVSIIQAVTQIQEQTLAFVPKLLAVAATFLVALPWTLQIMIKYTTELFRSLPSFVA